MNKIKLDENICIENKEKIISILNKHNIILNKNNNFEISNEVYKTLIKQFKKINNGEVKIDIINSEIVKHMNVTLGDVKIKTVKNKYATEEFVVSYVDKKIDEVKTEFKKEINEVKMELKNYIDDKTVSKEEFNKFQNEVFRVLGLLLNKKK